MDQQIRDHYSKIKAELDAIDDACVETFTDMVLYHVVNYDASNVVRTKDGDNLTFGFCVSEEERKNIKRCGTFMYNHLSRKEFVFSMPKFNTESGCPSSDVTRISDTNLKHRMIKTEYKHHDVWMFSHNVDPSDDIEQDDRDEINAFVIVSMNIASAWRVTLYLSE